MGAPKDIVGKKFNRLTVVAFSHYANSGKTKHYLCRCDCGTEKVIYGGSVSTGRTRSCGCLHREVSRKYEVATVNFQYAQHKKSGKDRGFGHLPFEDWLDLVMQRCHYCDQREIRNYVRTSGSKSKLRVSAEDLPRYDAVMVGVDRVNNDLGYTLENCVPCCGACNSMKMQLSRAEFLERVKRIYENKRTA